MGNRNRLREKAAKRVAFKVMNLFLCALLLTMGISACGKGNNELANKAEDGFDALSEEIGDLQERVTKRISEAEYLLEKAAKDGRHLYDTSLLERLRTEIDALKGLTIVIPSMASDESAITQQVEEMTAKQETLQNQYDSLMDLLAEIRHRYDEASSMVSANTGTRASAQESAQASPPPKPQRDTSDPWHALWGHWKVQSSSMVEGTVYSGSGDIYFSATTSYSVSGKGSLSISEYIILEEYPNERTIAVETLSYSRPNGISVITFSSNYLSADVTDYWEDGTMASVGTMTYIDSKQRPDGY